MTRPSLFQAAEATPSVNVLDAIHVPTATTRVFGKRGRLAWALVPFALVAVWLALFDTGVTPSPSQACCQAAAERIALAPRPEPVHRLADGVSPAQTPVVTNDSTGAAAQARLASMPTPSAIPRSAEASPRHVKPPARSTSPPQPKTKPATTLQPPSKAAAPTRPQTHTSSHTLAKAPVRSPASATDPDVELLSALMQHMGNAKPTQPASLTLAEQINECRRVGRNDATGCQQRVCAGVWGQEKACPTHLAPPARAPARGPATPG